jgi:hypothetical protein
MAFTLSSTFTCLDLVLLLIGNIITATVDLNIVMEMFRIHYILQTHIKYYNCRNDDTVIKLCCVHCSSPLILYLSIEVHCLLLLNFF